MKYISVYTTLPDENITEKIADKLIKERLVACVNYFPIKSIYRWKGKIEKDNEYALIMKSKRSLYQKLENRLNELHPYEIPAIVTYKIDEGIDEYLFWIKEETRNDNK
jgi:periplasmic divalent cation tolerance protein